MQLSRRSLIALAASTGIANFPSLVDAMRRKPLNFASGGNGSPGHLGIEVFRETGKFGIQPRQGAGAVEGFGNAVSAITAVNGKS